MTCIDVVLDQLLSVLEELGRSYKTFGSHPPHVAASETYLLSLASDCCRTHWEALRKDSQAGKGADGGNGWSSWRPLPKPVENDFVSRMFEHFKLLRKPIPDNVNIPARFILDEESAQRVFDPLEIPASRVTSSSSSEDSREDPQTQQDPVNLIDRYLNSIVEFVTASNWPATFDYFRSVIMRIRSSALNQGGIIPTAAMIEDERTSLVTVALFNAMWLDAHKLGLIIQELCSNILHFRKPFQASISHVVPILIHKWFVHYPEDFAKLHFHHKRIPGADTFFDMAQTIVDAGKRKMMLSPMQTCLLLLQPEVFEVACNFRDTKSGALVKKVAFLEGLKKSARNGNEVAVFCLVGAIHATRYLIHEEEEAGLVSYSFDIQDELRDTVFGQRQTGSDGVLFDQDMTTVTCITLIELNFNTFAVELTDICLRPNAPQVFQVALVQACAFFAQHAEAERFRPLLTSVAPFVQGQLKVNIPL